ncbi:FGGY family carbohydrate kinase [uncultured Cohaesibacter sp.]|uniref:FGGY family carbohydrate kinase n=1 Tax=uncultured Cohaesibacter sp. TaxID=1002546 RepID=UPI00374810F8
MVSYKDFIRYRPSPGTIATDRSEASVIPGNAEGTLTQRRHDRPCSGLKISAHLFPPVKDSESIAGGLTREVAATTGLPEGLPVAIGAGDVPCTVTGGGRPDAGSGNRCSRHHLHGRPSAIPNRSMNQEIWDYSSRSPGTAGIGPWSTWPEPST